MLQSKPGFRRRKEYIISAGGLSDKSLVFVLDFIQGKFHLVDYFVQNIYYNRPIIKIHNNGTYSLFELISKGGGTTDYRTDLHSLYKLTGSKIVKVLEVHEGTDLSGTLKTNIGLSMQMWDTTQKEDAVVLHYKAKFWLCNTYDAKSISPQTESNWDLYRFGSCNPADGVILLDNEYGMLCRWSNDSMKYIPDYSHGVSQKQIYLLENPGSDEEYAKKKILCF